MSIAARAVKGAFWNLSAGVGSRVVALVGTLVLTRFIAPGEYGEISAASIAVATAMTFTDFNVGQSIMARRVGPDVCYHAFVLHMAAAVVALVPVLALSGLLAGWLEAPDMARFVPGFALAALLERAGHVPSRVLVRDMRFRTVALTRGVAELTFTGLAVGLAPLIHGQAIVVGNLARFTLILAVYLRAVDRREWFVPQRLRWPPLRELLAFGLPLTAASLAEFAAANWDNMLIGRFFGTSTMGAYRLSRNLADTPVTNVAEHIGDVLLPSFALMEQERRNAALVRSASIMALLVFPLSAGLAAVAPTLARALFDRRWAGIGPFLAILSAFTVARPLAWAVTSFLQAQQHTRAIMVLGFLRVGSTLALVVALARFGPAWACAGVGAAGALHFAGNVAVAHRLDGVSGWSFFRGILPPALACVPMTAAVIGLRVTFDRLALRPSLASLAAEIAVGGVAYVAAAWLLARSTVDDVLNLLRNALRSRSATPAAVGPP